MFYILLVSYEVKVIYEYHINYDSLSVVHIVRFCCWQCQSIRQWVTILLILREETTQLKFEYNMFSRGITFVAGYLRIIYNV